MDFLGYRWGEGEREVVPETSPPVGPPPLWGWSGPQGEGRHRRSCAGLPDPWGSMEEGIERSIPW